MIHDFLFEPLFCSMVVELQPAVAVSAVAVLSSRHLVAASNEYGFALIDISKQSVLLQNSLVNHYGTFCDGGVLVRETRKGEGVDGVCIYGLSEVRSVQICRMWERWMMLYLVSRA